MSLFSERDKEIDNVSLDNLNIITVGIIHNEELRIFAYEFIDESGNIVYYSVGFTQKGKDGTYNQHFVKAKQINGIPDKETDTVIQKVDHRYKENMVAYNVDGSRQVLHFRYLKLLAIALALSERSGISGPFDKDEIFDLTENTEIHKFIKKFNIIGMKITPLFISENKEIKETREVNVMTRISKLDRLCFPRLITYTVINSDNVIIDNYGVKNKIQSVCNFLISIQEHRGETLSQSQENKYKLKELLFQLLHALYILLSLGYCHGDLHGGNITLAKVKVPDMKYMIININETDYYLPFNGEVLTLIDFGRAHSLKNPYHPIERYKEKFKDQWPRRKFNKHDYIRHLALGGFKRFCIECENYFSSSEGPAEETIAGEISRKCYKFFDEEQPFLKMIESNLFEEYRTKKENAFRVN